MNPILNGNLTNLIQYQQITPDMVVKMRLDEILVDTKSEFQRIQVWVLLYMKLQLMDGIDYNIHY